MTDLTFDYIIVGAGTAGCVIANRLSADPKISVCLIEAGPRDSHPFIHIPAATGAAIATASLNWRFVTAPQRHLNNRVLPQPRGRCLGGSSSINGMVYSRGHPRDFDDWAALGGKGWSAAEVLPYFKRSEENLNFRDSPWHGIAGEMAVSSIAKPNPLNAVFEQAMGGLGYTHKTDLNDGDPEGYGPRQLNIRNGRRESMATAFLRRIRNRPNLTIYTDTRVHRIRVTDHSARGVVCRRHTEMLEFEAKREVILTAGAVQSPQLLLLSGIGNGAHLQTIGIETRHHLPGVGTNLHDHPSAPVMMETAIPDSYGLSWRALPRNILHCFDYLLFRHGALASNLFESAAFLRTQEGLDRPDVQFVFQPARKMLDGFPVPVGHGYVLNPICLYPKSRGTLTLASPDPEAAPVIDTNLFADPVDFQPLLRGIRIARMVFGAPAFRHYNAVETGPGPALQSDDELVEYIRGISYPINHQVSTCRMGNDTMAVVDHELKVRGIEKLRVADASIFPVIIGGNTNATVVMVAEKATDLILGKPAPAAESNFNQ
jgi:choline dehydrogenase-like flavoprotein